VVTIAVATATVVVVVIITQDIMSMETVIITAVAAWFAWLTRVIAASLATDR